MPSTMSPRRLQLRIPLRPCARSARTPPIQAETRLPSTSPGTDLFRAQLPDGTAPTGRRLSLTVRTYSLICRPATCTAQAEDTSTSLIRGPAADIPMRPSLRSRVIPLREVQEAPLRAFQLRDQ